MGTHDITVVTDRTQGGPAEQTGDDAPLRRGTPVGRYLVLDVLGRGGMGIVYRAYDPKLDRPLALKRLRHRDTPADSPAHARLRREARTLARLSDPHVITVYDVGEDEAGLFIAMELVEGQDLAAWLRAGPHPWSQVAPRMLAAGRGLAAAHDVGVVHRDFKPANVLLDEDGRVVVTDFGLARPEAESTEAPAGREPPAPQNPDDPGLTAFGVRVGTPAYMAPEQHAGRPATARSDQYAFCVALFEAAHGRRPFEAADDDELAELKRRGPPQPAPEDRAVPGRVHRVLRRGLAPDPERRYPTMEHLLRQLDPAPTRRRTTTAAVVLALAGIAIAGVARSETPADPCAHAGQGVHEPWSTSRRDQLRAVLARGTGTTAEHAAARVPATLDAWAERWGQIHREVCEATWHRGEQSEAALDVRMECLEDGLRALDATVTALVEAEPDALAHAVELSLGLPSPRACRERSPHTTPAPAPAGGSTRVRTRLAQLDTMRRMGRGPRALDEAETLVREVGAGLDPDTGVSLHYTLGVLRDDAGDFGGAQQSFEESARLARRLGDPRREADAWIELTRVVGTHQHDPQRGEQLGALALATVEAAGNDPVQRAHALLELGEVAFRAGDDDLPLARWTEAEALRREHLGDRDAAVAQVQARLAGVDFRRGALDSARTRLTAAVERYREVFGPEHPRLAAPQGNLGFVLSALGEHDRALAAMRDALQIAEHSRGPHHPQVAGGHDAVGRVLLHAGRPEPAVPEFAAAVAGFERSLGPDHPAVGNALRGLGRARLAAGRPDEAVEPLERSLRLATSAERPPEEVAEARLLLALAVQGHDPARAEQLAAAAIPVLDASLPPDDDRRRDLEQWRRAHPSSPPSGSPPPASP